MSSALVTFDQKYTYSRLEEDMKFTWHSAFEKDNHYTLFRWEDSTAWIIFTCVFAFLIVLDNVVLNRNPKALTMMRATLFTLFWVLCAFGFCGWVNYYYGQTKAFMWLSGYMLEWMLSFDNLFVFHMIFSVYATPDHLKHRPLYMGIMGAVVFRLIFIFIGEYLMHAMFFVHFIFGAFLVWTGIKTITADDEDEDPSQQPIVQWLQRTLPFVPAYDSNGAFFVRVPVGKYESTESSPLVDGSAKEGDDESAHYGTVDFAAVLANSHGQRTELRATMLFLVVCCLEISDILFAVDSVSAIVAQVPDLFLAYTSAVFAMLGLRATFFIVDALVSLFSLLKYGVGAVLVFIGIKLIMTNMYHVPPSVVCFVLVTCVGSSMVASVVKDKMEKDQEAALLTLSKQELGHDKFAY